MLNISRTHYPLVNYIANPVQHGVQIVGELAGRAVNQLHQNQGAAIAFFVVSNYAFSLLAKFFATSVNHSLKECFVKFSDKEKEQKDILLNGIVIGTSVIACNAALSRATQNPLSQGALAVIAIVTIAVNTLLKPAAALYRENAANKKALASAQAEIERLNKEVLDKSAAEVAQTSVFDESLDSEEDKIKELKLQNDSRVAQLAEDSKKAIQDLEAQLAQIKGKLAAKEQEALDLRDKIIAFENDTAAKDSEIADLKQQFDDEKAANSTHVGELQQSIAIQEEEAGKLNAELATFKATINDLNAQIEGLEQEIESKKAENATLVDGNQNLRNDSQALKHTLEEKESEISTLQGELTKARAEKTTSEPASHQPPPEVHPTPKRRHSLKNILTGKTHKDS